MLHTWCSMFIIILHCTFCIRHILYCTTGFFAWWNLNWNFDQNLNSSLGWNLHFSIISLSNCYQSYISFFRLSLLASRHIHIHNNNDNGNFTFPFWNLRMISFSDTYLYLIFFLVFSCTSCTISCTMYMFHFVVYVLAFSREKNNSKREKKVEKPLFLLYLFVGCRLVVGYQWDLDFGACTMYMVHCTCKDCSWLRVKANVIQGSRL